mmetsp:Transcript_30592/g.97664  ORF Transcript_30592/g.97664 Transcript_30592/m.97664 type:complete len:95 (+) Transcript_30592:116-400(+)
MLGGHNTYQFEFRIDDRKMDLIGERRTGVPLWDPLWSTGAERFESTQKDIAKASASSPLEFREIAKRAVVLGSRPQDFGVDVDTAVRYASTMMM